MTVTYSNTWKGSKSSRASSNASSTHSHGSKHTQNTSITVYSDIRPIIKHYDTTPANFGRFVEEPFNDEDERSPRSSVETYASTVPSTEDLADTVPYQLPEERHICYVPEALPATAPEFATLFPSTRRIMIQHDDSTSDGNMNLRLDTEVPNSRGDKTKMTLFHLRMRDLHERQFSLRRYCRDSGREVCSSKKKYIKPTTKPSRPQRPSLQRSLSTAFHSISLRKMKAQLRQDSGYESDDDVAIEEDLKTFTASSEVEATIPTNVVRLEFSNYAQVEVHRCRRGHEKVYEFEYWGELYSWRRIYSVEEGEESIYSYELYNVKANRCIAYIMPDQLSREQLRQEERMGGWIPPSSMRVTDKTVSDDLGDVVVATGLVALTDDCIKRRWHSTRTARLQIPTGCSPDYIAPDQLVDEVFRRQGYTNPSAVKEVSTRHV